MRVASTRSSTASSARRIWCAGSTGSCAYLLVDRDADKAIVVALWESEAALAASAERAAHLR
jgi:hypothetical protein